MDNQRFAAKLKLLMAENNTTEADIAECLQASKASVRAWLSGEKTPKWDKLFLLADHFHISLNCLLGIEDTQPPAKR